ncbi:MAG: class I SAM-dependent methyltransferase, partial [Dongiales bacterium]
MHASQASPWILRFLPLTAPGGMALDLAAGTGRHSRLLLTHGLAVTALDRDPDQQPDAPGLTKIRGDLEDGSPWPLPGRRFDLVLVTNYLHRPILPDIIGAVGPGGLLLYETFAQGIERFCTPSNPDFLLRPGELAAAVAGRLEILAFEDLERGPPR